MKKNIAVFASGTGSNFTYIHDSLKSNESAGRIALCVSNVDQAAVLTRAADYGIPVRVFHRNQFATYAEYARDILQTLQEHAIDIIVLAGYLVKVPSLVTDQYAGRVINIHPALLPSFGGKGFFGRHVHEAVINAGVRVSGITIHFADGDYDRGGIILQKALAVHPDDSAESLAARVLKLEHLWYPRIVRDLCEGKIQRRNGKIIINE